MMRRTFRYTFVVCAMMISNLLGFTLTSSPAVNAASASELYYEGLTYESKLQQEQSAYSHITPSEQYQLPQALDWSSIPAHFMEEQNKQRNNQIQVFDVKKGSVILSVANNEDFQAEAKKWLSDITSLAPEIQPDMGATYIIRVPLTPHQTVNVGNVNLTAKEVFLFYYSDTDDEPLLLVFDENKKPYFFHIHEDVTPFLKKLELPH